MNDKYSTNHILIAEDSPTQAEELKYLLEKHNYRVRVAKDGKEALKCVVDHEPSLVISDIVMPGMNGYDLCKEIKSRDDTMDIPVILLTSLTRSEDVLEGISCGADNFITKPYREDYLIPHIDQILANRVINRSERVRVGVEIVFGGKKRFITAGQQQMLTLLISTYEAAVQKNDELLQTQDELKKLNEHLEELVTERTAELSEEIAIRKRAEKENQALARFPSEDPNPILRVGVDGKIIYANPSSEALLRMWNCAAGEYMPPEWRERVDNTAKRDVMTTVEVEWEVECEKQFYSIIIVPILDAGYVNLYSSNITERKRAEETASIATEHLVLSIKELEQFDYSVSHDLRAPLLQIAGFTDLLEKCASSVLDEKSRRYLNMIEAAAGHGVTLINEILDYSQLRRANIIKSNVNVKELVQEVVRDNQNGMKSRDIIWHIDELSDVYGDPVMLRRVFDNLISNALKYSRTRVHAHIQIGSTVGPEEVVCFVRDNGVGFEMEYVHNIFRVFQRLHRADEFEGNGIGLAIVSQIIERHGGRVWAEGAPDKGATFYFSLPHQRGGIEAVTAGRQSDRAHTRPYHAEDGRTDTK